MNISHKYTHLRMILVPICALVAFSLPMLLSAHPSTQSGSSLAEIPRSDWYYQWERSPVAEKIPPWIYDDAADSGWKPMQENFRADQHALAAIEEQGTITISTYSDDAHVFIKIADTGMGIPNEYLSRIYDPGFTTQSDGIGKGLGLSIVYNIIQKHHGSIEMESEVEKGTTIIIALPIKQV